MIDFVHASDLHLDSPITFLPTEKAVQLRERFRTVLAEIVDFANAHKAKLLLLPGDLFDKTDANYDTAAYLARTLAGFDGHVFIAPGNHDPYIGASPYKSVIFPKNVHIFTTQAPSAVHLPELDCTVYGAAFNAFDCTNPILNGFNVSGEGVNIGVFHGELDNSNSVYNPIMSEDIQNSNLDYLALGHVHDFSGVLKAGKTVYAYPGCPQGRGFDELGDKGIIYGRIEGGVAECSFVKTNTFAFTAPQIDISGFNSQEQLTVHILQQIKNPQEALCKISLLGEHTNPEIIAGLGQRLAEHLFYAGIVDKITLKKDIWLLAQQETLAGNFIKIMLEKYKNAPEQDKKLIETAARFGIAALGGEKA